MRSGKILPDVRGVGEKVSDVVYLPRLRVEGLKKPVVFLQDLVVASELIAMISEHGTHAVNHQPVAFEIRITLVGRLELDRQHARRLRIGLDLFDRRVASVCD